MTASRTWVLIADAGRARVLESEGPGRGLSTVKDLTFEWDLPPTHELARDRPSRSYESEGSARHAMTSGEDLHRREKRRSAEAVAEAVSKRHAEGAFGRLVVVAPPQVLGDLRDALPKSVRNSVVAEVAKDLTKTPDHEIASHLDLPFKL